MVNLIFMKKYLIFFFDIRKNVISFVLTII